MRGLFSGAIAVLLLAFFLLFACYAFFFAFLSAGVAEVAGGIHPPWKEKIWKWMMGELVEPPLPVVWGSYVSPNGIPKGLPAKGKITAYFGDPDYFKTFGKEHTGIDIAVPTGKEVLSTIEGKVIIAREYGGYGNLVVVQNGPVAIYLGHLSELKVKEGDVVQRGQVVGLSGSTGFSTGPHIHYEVRVNGKAVDPLLAELAHYVEELAPPPPPPPSSGGEGGVIVRGDGVFRVSHAITYPPEATGYIQGRVVGEVRDSSGRPLPGVVIRVTWPTDHVDTVTGPDGRYEVVLGGKCIGCYSVFVLSGSSQQVVFSDPIGHTVTEVNFIKK
ncbi:MAG: peptidoglycan DD-metalloendopeptidase family protein [Candidatus Hadarchaeales archaeon]